MHPACDSGLFSCPAFQTISSTSLARALYSSSSVPPRLSPLLSCRLLLSHPYCPANSRNGSSQSVPSVTDVLGFALLGSPRWWSRRPDLRAYWRSTQHGRRTGPQLSCLTKARKGKRPRLVELPDLLPAVQRWPCTVLEIGASAFAMGALYRARAPRSRSFFSSCLGQVVSSGSNRLRVF